MKRIVYKCEGCGKFYGLAHSGEACSLVVLIKDGNTKSNFLNCPFGLDARDWNKVSECEVPEEDEDTKEKGKEYEALATELCEKFGERGTETRRIVRAKRD